MPLFLIERSFAEDVLTDVVTVAGIKQINDEIGIQWLYSFLSADKRKTYCLYEAPSEEAIREAARSICQAPTTAPWAIKPFRAAFVELAI